MNFLVNGNKIGGFSGILFYQVIVSGSKLDNFGSRKIAHPVMYDSSIFIDFPGSSLRTNKQTNKHTNRHTHTHTQTNKQTC